MGGGEGLMADRILRYAAVTDHKANSQSDWLGKGGLINNQIMSSRFL